MICLFSNILSFHLFPLCHAIYESISCYSFFFFSASASCFQPEFSIMFVVFDAEESGCRGSQEFIASHLKPHLKATGGKIQGAFILDTILNYDSRPGSQHYSQVYSAPNIKSPLKNFNCKK